MPLIPEFLVDRVKREIPIADLVTRAGIELRRLGTNLAGRCNRHEDDTPSLMVSEEKNLFHEMGACQRGGSTIDWVMWQDGLGFHEAARKLIEEFFPDEARQLFSQSQARPSRRFRAEALPSPVDAEAEGQELDRQVVAYYHQTGKESPELHAYLQKRGLDDVELVERFKIGLANRTLGMRLSSKLRKRCQERGWLREKTGHEHLNGSAVLAIPGTNGEIVNCYGRKIRDDLNARSVPHLYLPRPLRGLLNREAFQASGEIVLCEAPIDFLSAWRHGFRHSTCTWGAEGFTDEHLEAFVTHRIERCLIAFDRDEAGDRGAAEVARRLSAVGVACYRVLFPKGMDLNDVAVKMHPAQKTLAVFFRSAEWMCGGSGGKTSVAGSASQEITPRQARQETHALAASTGEAAESTSGSSEGQAVAAEEAIAVAAEKVMDRAAEKGSSPAVPAVPPAPAPLDPASAAEASPAEAAPRGLIKLGDDEADFAFDDRRYRARGLRKCLAYGSLRVSLRAERIAPELFLPPSPLEGWHLDTVDLCVHKQRTAFEREAAHEMGVKEEVVHRDLGHVVRGLEDVQEKRVSEATGLKQKAVAMSAAEAAEALAFWKSPDLMRTIVEHFTTCGLVGEETNKLATYIAACSRLLDRPLAIIIQSSSAAGKSSLMDALLSFMPEEMREKYTAVSGKSLFYFDEGTVLRHKILAIVEEEGAEKATYPLKILQSEGELVMASTGKDPTSGKLVTKTYRVEGPVMIILTTTSIDLDPELENRCLLLTVDESREHTRAIHELQRLRMTFEGYERKAEKERLEKLHRNAQRLLRRVNVHNPYARRLTFVDEQTRTRRDHAKYLALIETIALMHQYQRPLYRRSVNGREEEFVDVELADIELAGRLAGEVLGKYLEELKPQTRTFLLALHGAVTKLCQENGVDRSDLRFTRRQIRELTGWNDTQLRVHMARLIELEYVLVHRGGRGQSFVYELLYNGEGIDGRPFLLGLVDVDALRETAAPATEMPTTTPTSRGEQGYLAGGVRPECGGDAGGVRGGETGPRPALQAASGGSGANNVENALLPASPEEGSYVVGRSRTPRLNLLRFPPRPKPAEGRDERRDTPSATVTPIPKPPKRLPGGRSGRPLRRVQPDAVL